MIQLVALDMAGTTVEEHQTVYRVLAETVRALGADPSQQEIDRWHGADKRDALRHLLAGSDGTLPAESTVDRAVSEFRSRLKAAYAAQPPTALAGVPEALAQLRAAGIKVALTTGFDREVADALLAQLGWDSTVIDAVVCSDEVAAGRPAPYLIHRAMERTGVYDVTQVLVAGDTQRDLEAGVHSGAAYVVGVLSGASSAEELGAVRHTHVLPSVASLPSLLDVGARELVAS